MTFDDLLARHGTALWRAIASYAPPGAERDELAQEQPDSKKTGSNMSAKVNLFVHLVWGTSARQPTISRGVAEVLRQALVEKSRLLRCSLMELGGTADHVHLLAALNPSVTVARLVGELKGVSSHAVNLQKPADEPFYWQKGYAAFTVSDRELAAVAGYVRDQARRHADQTIDPRLEPDADEFSAPGERATALRN